MGAAGLGALSPALVGAVRQQSGWVKARSFSYYLVAFQGGMGIGSLALGAVAQASTVSTAFFVIAGGLAIAAIITWPLALPASAAGLDLMAEPLPLPAVIGAVEDGPALVTVEYALASGRTDAFLAAAGELRRARRRTGATRWHLHRDLEDTGLFTETFLVGSWQEHERQHARLAREDREVLDRIDALLRPDRPRTAHHAVGVLASRRRPGRNEISGTVH